MTAQSVDDGARPAPFHLILLALIPFGFGYFLAYLFRAVNAVVSPDLTSELQLTAADLGMITSAYLFAFAAFQLPLGVLLDRFGPRRVQAILVALGAAGAALFAVGEDVVTLTLARALIGLGFAGGLMAGFKAVVVWVMPERRALANAFVMSAGAVGLIVSTSPTEWAVGVWGWRTVFMGLAGVTALVALMILVMVPERGRVGIATDPLGVQLKQLGHILVDPVFLSVVPLIALTAATQIAIQTLWAGPWLRDVAGLDRQGVADLLAFAAFAFLFGVLASGAIADALQRRGVSLLTTMNVFLMTFLAAQAVLLSGVADANAVVWFVFGMSGQVAVLAYPWMAQHFGAQYAGRSNAGINMIMFSLAFIAQYAIGALIDLYPRAADGSYPAEAYRMAFGVFFALQIVALVWYVARGSRIRAAEAAFKARARA